VGLICFSDAADGTKEIVQENWLVLLFRELEKQGITLPERALFSSQPKTFHPSHRMFEHMHGALNVNKKN